MLLFFDQLFRDTLHRAQAVHPAVIKLDLLHWGASRWRKEAGIEWCDCISRRPVASEYRSPPTFR